MSNKLDWINRYWPPFRTNRQVRPSAIWRASFLGGLGSCLVPLFFGVLLSALAIPFETVPPSAFYSAIGGLGLILVISPLVALIAVVPALFLAVGALRAGFAGWVVATGAGAIVATMVFAFAISIQGNPVVVGGIFGSLYGALFWMCARLSTPEAFVRPADVA